MEDDPSTTGEEDRATLVSLCCEAKVAELRGKLALRQFKQVCSDCLVRCVVLHVI